MEMIEHEQMKPYRFTGKRYKHHIVSSVFNLSDRRAAVNLVPSSASVSVTVPFKLAARAFMYTKKGTTVSAFAVL